ncbi:MAG: hypothetical protein GWN31_04655, partial [Candidatus Thorarchaeota archaeon]|nr:hypothetical protein [Candidatus Thorarchaeota archaeon]
MFERPSDCVLPWFVPLFQLLQGSKHWKYSHCVLYVKDDNSWLRIDLTWDGLNEQRFFLYEDEDTIIEEADFGLTVCVPFTFNIYKRLGWLKALALID